MKFDILYVVVQGTMPGDTVRKPIVFYTEEIASAIETMTALRFLNRSQPTYLLCTLYGKNTIDLVCGYPAFEECSTCPNGV